MALKNGIEADPWLPMHQNFKNRSQANQRRDSGNSQRLHAALCSKLLIKTTVKCHCTLIRIARLRFLGATIKQQELSLIVGANIKQRSHFGK